ncbi:MAG: aspartate/glutamate racemase family protein [Thermovirgaceae bacterium]|nr:aspartate/glutamate racemase family protein [Thermovirgaceae bacterium]
MLYYADERRVVYGVAIGILMMETTIPFLPGDVGNATSYDFPVLYQTVKGLTTMRMFKKDQTAFEEFYAAAQMLRKQGVRSITGVCGYMLAFQDELAEKMDIPVFLSTLLQIPFILKTIGRSGKVGVLCANGESLTPEFLKIAGVLESDLDRVAVHGLEGNEHFREVIHDETGCLDSEKMAFAVVEGAGKLVRGKDGVKAILLECSDLPPYAAAVQKATGLPVFDFNSMIRYVHSVVLRKEFYGVM